MATPDNDSVPSAAPIRPSWETARPAPRPAPAPQRPAYAPAAAPVYAPPAMAAYEAPAYQPPTDLEGDVKYDLAGNPIPGSGSAAAPMTSAMAPPAPFGYSVGQAAGTWPPPPGGAGHGAHAYRNNSGEQSHLPPELERLRWHWGAFFFPTFWSRRHGLRALAFVIVAAFVLLRVLRLVIGPANTIAFLAICVFYAAAHLGVQIYFGLNGHKMAWRNRHFPGGVEEYLKVQSAWMWWGFGVNFLLAPLLCFGVFAATIGAVLTGRHSVPSAYGSYHNSPYGSGYHRHYYSGYGSNNNPGSGSSYGNGGSGSGSSEQ